MAIPAGALHDGLNIFRKDDGRLPLGALVDPRFDRGDLCGFQRIAFHRHRRFVEAGDHPVQLAALRAARNKSSAVRTTFDGRVAVAEVEFG